MGLGAPLREDEGGRAWMEPVPVLACVGSGLDTRAEASLQLGKERAEGREWCVWV